MRLVVKEFIGSAEQKDQRQEVPLTGESVLTIGRADPKTAEHHVQIGRSFGAEWKRGIHRIQARIAAGVLSMDNTHESMLVGGQPVHRAEIEPGMTAIIYQSGQYRIDLLFLDKNASDPGNGTYTGEKDYLEALQRENARLEAAIARSDEKNAAFASRFEATVTALQAEVTSMKTLMNEQAAVNAEQTRRQEISDRRMKKAFVIGGWALTAALALFLLRGGIDPNTRDQWQNMLLLLIPAAVTAYVQAQKDTK